MQTVDISQRWPDLGLPAQITDVLQHCKSLHFPRSREEVLSLAMGGQCEGLFEVAYEVPGRGRVIEATVAKCSNGLAVNYTEPYMRRRDPDCSVIGAAAAWILSRWPPYRRRHHVADAERSSVRGGVVAFPTETVYGLGANAFDRAAVQRVFEIKNRPRFDPLIVHVADARQVRDLVRDFPAEARMLARRFWPGPLTLVLPKIDRLPDLVTAGLPTVAIRIPNHALALALLEEVGSPVAAPSANPFGMLSPTTAEHVRDQLGDQVDVILDGGPCAVGVESTIVSFCGARPTLLRPGGIAAEDLEAVLGPLVCPSPHEPVPLAPGRLPRHYAPRTPLVALLGSARPSGRPAGGTPLPNTAPGCRSFRGGGSIVGSGRLDSSRSQLVCRPAASGRARLGPDCRPAGSGKGIGSHHHGSAAKSQFAAAACKSVARLIRVLCS